MTDTPSGQDVEVQARVLTLREEHDRAVTDLALSLHGLGKGLSPDVLPHTASEVEGLLRYGASDGGWTPRFSLWLHWRNGMRVVATWDDLEGTSRAAPDPVVIPEPDAMTDGEPGLAVGALAPADEGTEDQPRLGLP